MLGTGLKLVVERHAVGHGLKLVGLSGVQLGIGLKLVAGNGPNTSVGSRAQTH